jgi:REP element-mobilizing transposase RayT
MAKKYLNKYRIESIRLKGYDYSSEGAYFITIVTKNREHFFGEIVDGKMIFNVIGDNAQKYWDEIPQHFSFIRLDEMVVMPNHIHGILWIDKLGGIGCDVACNVATGNTKNKKMMEISPKRGSIATVIRSYKSVVTNKSRQINPNFAWQPRFHDHIIRNEKSLNRIRKYIRNNPVIWQRDRNKEDVL